jgi:hypothetical protein
MSYLFGPSVLTMIILGVVIITISLIIFTLKHLHNKVEEQNHKISSMLSLVSTIVEDMNIIKIDLHNKNLQNAGSHLGKYSQNNLIEVSDDETTNTSENLFDNDNSIVSLDEDDTSMENEVKYVKIVIDKSNENELVETDVDSDEYANTHDYNDTVEEDEETDDEDGEDDGEEDGEDDGEDDTNIADIDETVNITFHNEGAHNEGAHNEGSHNEGSHNEVAHNEGAHNEGAHNEGAHNEGTHNEGGHNIEAIDLNEIIGNDVKQQFDLKMVHIDLEENTDTVLQNNEVNYKKMSVQQLRNIVTEKGLATDAGKLKKPELLKLLE